MVSAPGHTLMVSGALGAATLVLLARVQPGNVRAHLLSLTTLSTGGSV